MWTADQFLAAHKANVEAVFGVTSKMFEGAEKLMDLNVQATKAAVAEAQDNTRALLSVKDAQELMAFQAGLMQPAAEKAASYTRHVYEITTATGGEVSQAAEAQMTEAQRKLMGLIDSAAKNAPAGTDNVVSFVRSAVAAANNAFEGVQKAAKQAADVADANFQAVTNTAMANVKATGARSKRAA
jgi:phasin family protein